MHPTIRPALALLALLTTLAATAGALPPAALAQALPPTATPAPRPDERPDRCEPNPDQPRACRLELDAVGGPFTLLPEGDQDVYAVQLPAAPDGMQTTVSVRGTPGLDLLTTIRRADSGAVLGTISAPAISTTLAADTAGWVVLRVENRAPGLASGQSYRVEVRRTLPPAPATPPPGGPEGLARDPLAPDALENSYSPETAAPIGVGVLYDLNFVCPVAGACTGGDHDYLRFDAKAGVGYLLATFDLAPGVDTALDLLWWSPERGWHVLASNDDARPGSAFLSALRWQAPGDGTAIARIGPRTGGLNPILGQDEPLSAYRFAVALADSPLAAQIEERVAAQTNAPAEAPAAPGDPGPAPAAIPAPTAFPIEATAGTGEVMVVEETTAYAGPDAGGPALGTLPLDAIVRLTGKTAGLWAEVTSGQIVGASWVNRRALRPVAASQAPQAAEGGAAPTQAGPSTHPAAVTRAAPRALPQPEAAPPRVSAQAALVARRGAAGRPGLRAQLVTALNVVISEQVTDLNGEARFLTGVPADTALFIVVPALGLRIPVSMDTPVTTVTLPEER